MKLEHLICRELSDVVIKAFYKVYNELGFGFLERVYQNALYLELKSCGLEVVANHAIDVYYQNSLVGNYFADILVNDLLILELKAAASISAEHELQLINYLKATDLEVGLLLNFGKKPEVRRKIFTNDKKTRNK